MQFLPTDQESWYFSGIKKTHGKQVTFYLCQEIIIVN